MAQVVSPHIWYPAGYPGVAVDLRQISMWNPQTVDSVVFANVRFAGTDVQPTVRYELAAFELAKQASMTAGG